MGIYFTLARYWVDGLTDGQDLADLRMTRFAPTLTSFTASTGSPVSGGFFFWDFFYELV